MTAIDKQVIEDINNALALLGKAHTALMQEAERHYANGDNRRGNIRHDAGYAVRLETERIKSRIFLMMNLD